MVLPPATNVRCVTFTLAIDDEGARAGKSIVDGDLWMVINKNPGLTVNNTWAINERRKEPCPARACKCLHLHVPEGGGAQGMSGRQWAVGVSKRAG